MKKKKSVLIVTITSINFGNRLQNYALQTILGKYFEKVKTYYSVDSRDSLIRRLVPTMSNLTPVVQWMRSVKYKKGQSFFALRGKFARFAKFNKLIKFEKSSRSIYEYYFAGSDQIWNTTFNLDMSKTLLAFTDSKNKVAYAASLGMRCLDAEHEKVFRSGLNKFQAISVREADAAVILQSITERPIQTIIDPTLSLDVEQWNKVAEKPKKFEPAPEYVFCYTLGGDSIISSDILKSITDDGSIPIYNPTNIKSKAYYTGPAEFIWLIKNAKTVITDSYHAVIFSILYRKPFVLCLNAESRAGMLGRFETLANKLGLDYNKMASGEVYIPDYDEVFTRLSEERKKAIDFLEKAIDYDGGDRA